MAGRMVGGRLGVLVALALASACSDGAADTGVAPPPDTGPSDDLAPSQLTAETAPPPETPPPCEPASTTVWTAQVAPFDGWADAVLRVRNDGDVRCEVDVGASPLVDPLMEPDVWLGPGEWADLVIGAVGDECAERATVRLAQLDLNGEQVVVETAAIVPCGWMLTAFYPNEVSDVPCAELDGAVVDGAVLVRNRAVHSCRLGELVGVEGEGASLIDRPVDLAVPMLAPGDVVAVGLERDGAGGDRRRVALVFDSGVTIDVDVDGVVQLAAGPPQPWIGGPGSPTADDPDELLLSLDPFTRDQ